MKVCRHSERSEAKLRDPVEVSFKVKLRDPSTSLGMTVLIITFFLCCSAHLLFAETDAEITARRNALDVAGAFTNDGFKLRDGHWCGTAKPDDHALIAVNLFAGNQYWFAVGTADMGRKIEVNVYDEGGKLITTEHYQAGDRAAAGFSPTDSGQYFVAVDLAEGAPTNFCLIYSYK
jgi:hypothetical protein